MQAITRLSDGLKQYLLITGNYWVFTLTDGALRMLVVLHFHQLGYSPLNIALLFLFYEVFGVITNLLGGWLGAILGLNRTMNIGLAIQIIALSMLLVEPSHLTVAWVMIAQALSGIAKDLNKMSAKSAIKLLIPSHAQTSLYKWVALLTGSKNTLKGIGFFLGGLLLNLVGFHDAILLMVIALVLTWVISLIALKKELGKTRFKPAFNTLFSKEPVINYLSAARLFLFSARDVWFVVALPVYLSTQLGYDFWKVGGLLACWVIGYGVIQAFAPTITGQHANKQYLAKWAYGLFFIPALMALALHYFSQPAYILLIGLVLFGFLFAINSSLHSYLIVSHAQREGVSMDVGFYYMANAFGRLIGTLLSGWLYQLYGLESCLWVSSIFIAIAAIISTNLASTK
mgnify:FL=1